ELERLLDGHRHHVLAVLQLVLLLDATGDDEEAVLIDIAHVPRAEASIAGERLRVLLGEVVVAEHHVVAVDHDLAVALVAGDAAVDLDANAGRRLADAAQTTVARVVGGRDGAGLGEAVATDDVDAQLVDDVADFGADGRGDGEDV